MPHGDTAQRMPAVLLRPLLLIAVLFSLFSTSGLAQRGAPARLGWVEPTPLDPTVAERLFTAYDAGRYAEFDRLAGTLASSVINPFEFEADAERWMDAATDRRQGAFVAAAVALELASTSVRYEWTAIQLRYVLAELGCAWLRDHPPVPAEEFWHEADAGLGQGAGGQGGQGGVPVADPIPRLAELGRMPIDVVSRAEKRRVEDDDRWRSEHQAVMTRLRRQATRSSGSTRIETSRFRFEHGQHLRARFPDNPLPLFLEATLRERQYSECFNYNLLDGRFLPIWLDAADVDRIATGGARAVGTVPPDRRMDRPSADRLIRIVPEPEWSLASLNAGASFTGILPAAMAPPSGARVATIVPIGCGPATSAAFASLKLWEIVDGFQAVPAGAPVAAETALRLGYAYALLARPDLALPAFARAEALATTPYELYLTRLLAGAVFAHAGRRTEAITAFRGALQAVPRAQSASFALAPLLLEVGAREEAAEILEAATRLPLADDPQDHYWTGDPSRGSRALARLREEVRR